MMELNELKVIMLPFKNFKQPVDVLPHPAMTAGLLEYVLKALINTGKDVC